MLVHEGMLIYTDFGYSFNSNGFSRSTTQGRPSFLTRRFSPPEVIEPLGRSSKSDVHSLGCVFLEMLSVLRPAFEVDADQYFPDVMASIHTQLSTLKFDSRLAFIPGVILRMTCYNRRERLCAEHVMGESIKNPSFGCFICSQLLSVPITCFASGVACSILTRMSNNF